MFGALRVETYRGSRSIEQAQVLAIPPEGYDSPSRATPPPPLTPITFCQVSLTVQRYPYITFVGERRCGRCECLVLEHNTATMPRIESSTSTLWPPFLIQQKAMNLLYFSSVALSFTSVVNSYTSFYQLIILLKSLNLKLFENSTV